MKPKHSDVSAGWIKREIAGLKKQIRESNAAKKLQAATIGRGGLTVKDGGSLSAAYPPGVGGRTGVWFGPVPPAESQAGAALGLQVSNESGQYIFQVLRQYPNTDFPLGQSVLSTDTDMVVMVADALTLYRSDLAAYVSVDPDGVTLAGGSGGVHITHSTTAASANCFIDASDNRIWRSTSSARYKAEVEEAQIDPADVLALRPVTFLDKGEVQRARAEADKPAEERHVRRPRRYVGLLAEDVAKIPSLRPFVTLDDDGRPEALDYDRLTVALVTLAQSQQKTLDKLDERVAALEADNA